MSAALLTLVALLAPPATPVMVELECVVTRHAGDEAIPVARPKVRTLTGRAAKIEVSTGAGDGRPAEALTFEMTPSLTGDTIALSGAAQLRIGDRAPIEAKVEGGALTLEADAARRYAVRCTPRRVTE